MKRQGENFTKDTEQVPSYLEHAIVHTLKYFNVLGMPLTTTQLWRFLLIPNPTAPQRWEGHAAPSLAAVRAILQESSWLAARIDQQWGYYCLKHQSVIVPAWLRRHAVAQQKWKIIRRVVRALTWIPFVELLAVSGSMALYNTKSSSDFDMLVVTHPRRIWTVRLLLLLMAQVVGRRRKYWDQEAPDKLCFNHFVTSQSLMIAPEIRNEYTATLYSHLVPLWGTNIHDNFMVANAGWLKRWSMYRDPINAWTTHVSALPRAVATTKQQLEHLLLEPIGDAIEAGVAFMQRRIIMRHTSSAQGGRIVVSGTELAFHPHSRVPGILNRFAQDTGQQQLL